MHKFSTASLFATGFSMFSMFFGAGNVVFPLILGQAGGSYMFFAATGLMLTGIILPFLGLLSMMLYESNFREYFFRLGKWPGLIIIFLIMALLGPFAGMPRTVTLTQSTMELSGADIAPWLFNGLFCLVFFAFAYKPNRIVDILGYILTPVLLALLALITIAGLMSPDDLALAASTDTTPLTEFVRGATTGYNTMDLLAALFFSSVVLAAMQLRYKKDVDPNVRHQHILKHAAHASLLGGVLLGLVYIGFFLLSVKYSVSLEALDADQLIAYLSYKILGSHGSWLVNGIVSLACLTTAIALASVFAQVIGELFTGSNKYYPLFLLLTTLATYGMSFIGFSAIIELIYPPLVICYPAVIVLAFLNAGHKLWGWRVVKTPVFVTAALATVLYVW